MLPSLSKTSELNGSFYFFIDVEGTIYYAMVPVDGATEPCYIGVQTQQDNSPYICVGCGIEPAETGYCDPCWETAYW